MHAALQWLYGAQNSGSKNRKSEILIFFKQLLLPHQSGAYGTNHAQSLGEVHCTRARQVRGPGKVKVLLISFSVIKPKIILVWATNMKVV